jgi:hypothetical protein
VNTSPTDRLVSALEERLSVIADREWYARDAASHLVALQSVSERITELSRTLPEPVNPQLRHYLERASFDKALAHLKEDKAVVV